MVTIATAEELEFAIGSGRLHAQRFGSLSAPLVIAMHGLSGSMKTFDYIGERLGGDTLQLIALDLRGRGHSAATGPGTYGWENHARDVLAVADALGFDRFSLVGHSMGGSVAMKTAELDGSRLDALVLIDVAGRVDPGIGPVITSVMDQLSESYDSIDAYLAAVRGQGLVEPWTEHWERAHRYQLLAVDGRVRARLDPAAVAEDRAYTATQHPYDRWRHLTMSTLLLRATQELSPGAGHVVPADDRDRFLREVRDSTVVEIDANHLTITTHPNTVVAINTFLGTSRP